MPYTIAILSHLGPVQIQQWSPACKHARYSHNLWYFLKWELVLEVLDSVDSTAPIGKV